MTKEGEFSHIKYNGKLYRPCEVGSHSVNGILDLTREGDFMTARDEAKDEAVKLTFRFRDNYEARATAIGEITRAFKKRDTIIAEKDATIDFFNQFLGMDHLTLRREISIASAKGLIHPSEVLPKMVRRQFKEIEALRSKLAKLKDLIIDDVPHQYQTRLLGALNGQ